MTKKDLGAREDSDKKESIFKRKDWRKPGGKTEEVKDGLSPSSSPGVVWWRGRVRLTRLPWVGTSLHPSP